jgi:hypothetical protein
MNKQKVINKQMKFEGRKLGYLLNKANLSPEIKDELVDLVDEMSPEQVRKLIDVLENQYLDYETRDIDKIFINKLKEF